MTSHHPARACRLAFRLGLLGVAIHLLPTCDAARGDRWLDGNLASWHSRSSYFWKGEVRHYNQTNLGLGLSYDLNDWSDLKFGWFDNSYGKTSVYGAIHGRYDFIRGSHWMIAPGCGIGVVTGYHHTPDDLPVVSPLLIPTLTLGDEERWRILIGYLPFHLLLGKDHADVATLQVGWKL